MLCLLLHIALVSTSHIIVLLYLGTSQLQQFILLCIIAVLEDLVGGYWNQDIFENVEVIHLLLREDLVEAVQDGYSLFLLLNLQGLEIAD
jgi:hypothetical protein